MRQGLAAAPAVPAKLTRAERRAINRQAWAESAGQIHAAFHARREALIREYAEAQEDARDRLPPWVQKERPS
jgi:hypothetical protein